MPVYALLEDFNAIIRAVLNRDDSRDLFTTIVESAARLMDATYGEITLVDEDHFVIRAVTANQNNLLGQIVRPDEAHIAWEAYSTGKPVAVDDYTAYQHRRDAYEGLNLRAVVEIPMMVNHVCVGLLGMARVVENYPFSSEDLSKGILLAQFATLVLDQKNLYDSALRELAERKKVEEALRESEERYRTLVDALGEGIVFQDREGTILASNPSAERILGISADQMMGRTSIDPRWHTIYEDFSPFPGEDHPAMITLRTGKPLNDIIMGVHKPDGEITWISINSRPMFKPGESRPYAVIASFTDITRRKHTEKHTLQLASERQRAALLAGFIQDASHEFRTPLAIIQTSLYLLNRTDNPTVREEKTRLIEWQVRLINRLVTMLSLQVRLDSGQWAINRVSLNLNDIVNRVVGELMPEIDNHRHQIHITVGGVIPVIEGDEEMIETALYQIIENAARYTLDSGKISIRVRKVSLHCEVEIEDNGVGIPETVLPHIFTRFYRRDVSHTTPGFGLGLSIAARVVEEHGGHINVKSEVGVGSVFTISLPTLL